MKIKELKAALDKYPDDFDVALETEPGHWRPLWSVRDEETNAGTMLVLTCAHGNDTVPLLRPGDRVHLHKHTKTQVEGPVTLVRFLGRRNYGWESWEVRSEEGSGAKTYHRQVHPDDLLTNTTDQEPTS